MCPGGLGAFHRGGDGSYRPRHLFVADLGAVLAAIAVGAVLVLISALPYLLAAD